MKKFNPDKINHQVLTIWEDSKESNENEEFVELPPMIYPRLKKRPNILFVGLNPSFNKKKIRGWCKDLKINMIQYFDNWHEGDRENLVKELTKIEEKARKEYLFFKTIQEGVKKYSFETIDLFFFRKSEGKKITQKEIMEKEFLKRQLDLTSQLIKKIKPKRIVVMGKLAQSLYLNIIPIYCVSHPSRGYQEKFKKDCKMLKKFWKNC